MIENKILFIHPSKYLGGTEILFKRSAEILIKKNYKIYIVDYNDGELKKLLKNEKVIFIDYLNYSTWAPLLSSHKVIVSSRNALRVLNVAKRNDIPSIDMLSWVLHPSELYTGYIPGVIKIKNFFGCNGLQFSFKMNPFFSYLKSIIKYLNNKGQIHFMDQACVREVQWALSEELENKQYLPLITSLEQQCSKEIILSGEIEFLIISRIDDFKTQGIIKVISDVKDYASKKKEKYKLHIIGDGKDLSKVKELSKAHENIEIVFHGFIANNDLQKFLSSHNIQILFAMGTSALEGLARGLVTVLLPCSDKKITQRDDVYKIMHHQNNNSLGEYLDTPYESAGYLTLCDVFTKLDKIAIETKAVEEYFYKNFSKEKTESDFITAINKSNRISLSNILNNKFAWFYLDFINQSRIKKGF